MEAGRGESRRLLGFWGFAAASVQPSGSRLFTLKKFCRRQPDLSSLNRSFVMLLPCYKTFSVFYSENVNFWASFQGPLLGLLSGSNVKSSPEHSFFTATQTSLSLPSKCPCIFCLNTWGAPSSRLAWSNLPHAAFSEHFMPHWSAVSSSPVVWSEYIRQEHEPH